MPNHVELSLLPRLYRAPHDPHLDATVHLCELRPLGFGRSYQTLTRTSCAGSSCGPIDDPPPQNLDIVALQGRAPWLRVRVGNWRVLCRPLSSDELSDVVGTAERGFLVARIVNRRDLERAVATLPRID